jgi:hypothetical protein
MKARREEAIRFAERNNLGAFKGTRVLGDTVIYGFERGSVREQLPANAEQ